jgi:quinol-cytochrome oxidoreductase complex cytochrome b subunit
MSENKPPEEKTVPFFPDHLLYEAKVAMWFGIGLIIIGVIGMFYPVGLGEPADPMETPEHTTPEWYFLWLFQLLKYFKGQVPGTEIEGHVLGALFPVLLVGILALWPFLENKPDKTKKPVYYRSVLAGIVMIIIIILTILGEVT